ncbi:acetyl-CoA hydrolase/transferase family protein [Enterococcus sp. HY326]|uniref:acetyl-CoA hydrolase/transferase family protein n=1 Tax=Enterococcus sp. HY326 TaxID=2971265 RepID=UPI00223F3DBF|nr:acetyl-CoA hydrolase/transferase C-terminal domain-containing protein [Enterococcus sp. HY326]
MSKYVTAEEAVKVIKDGDSVVIGLGCGEPSAVIREFGKRIPELKNVVTSQMLPLGTSPYSQPEAIGHVRHNSLYVGGKDRKAVAEGYADYTPRFFSRMPALFTDGSINADVALIEVSRVDQHGYASLGISVDYTMTAAKNAKIVIAQVNNNLPRTHGNCFMHVDEFDYIVEEDTPILELPKAAPTPEEVQIGKYCASMIKDGDTLQLGIGSLPDAVLDQLHDKKDLGIHSEMFSDGVMQLVKMGVINNSKKNLNPGKMIATFLMGTREFYDFVDDNPSVMMAPVDYTNDPYVIAQNDNLISINSCVQVDLTGQVASETIGPLQISSVGGQLDFVRGANMSKGGISIIAMPSTTKNNTISKIVPFLDLGSVVTTGRNDVAVIVTEYGIADLRGKSIRERSRALIEIAHPNFREELEAEWEKRYGMKW